MNPMWFATRATGEVAMLLLTAVTVLGIITSGGWAGRRWPRIVTTGLHRNVSLLAVVFLVLHIGTTGAYRVLGRGPSSLAVGAGADFVTLATDTPRTAGARLDQLWYAAGAADVREVVVAGERVVSGGRHRLGDVGALLADAIAALTTGDRR